MDPFAEYMRQRYGRFEDAPYADIYEQARQAGREYQKEYERRAWGADRDWSAGPRKDPYRAPVYRWDKKHRRYTEAIGYIEAMKPDMFAYRDGPMIEVKFEVLP